VNDLDLDKCIHKQEYWICSNAQTLNIQDTNNCETELFSNQDRRITKSCEVKIMRIDGLILHKLHNENVWLYTTRQPMAVNIDLLLIDWPILY